MAEKQPVGFAAMEGVFGTEEGVGLVIMGQPDVERMRLDNPLEVPGVLSFLTHRRWSAEIKGLESFPKEDWPHNIPLLYYAYHIMVGLGTIMIAVLAVAAFLLWKRRLYSAHWMLWTLMLLLPFPYIANTAGWMTVELGRQPWVIYGLMRTSEGYSVNVSAGNALFSLLGFMGVYVVLSVLFLFPRVSEDLSGARARRDVAMETVWFWLVALMFVVYIVLDGFDLGAGAVHLFVARTEAERRTVIRSIGPVWDGNEVWLIAAGGTLYFAFPGLFSTAFSGFYLPLMIMLWLLIGRAAGIEFRNQIDSPAWKPLWDVAFAVSSALLALFFGVALGNVVRGVPLDVTGRFFAPLWTDFWPHGATGILDWYTLAVGLAALAALAMHGALWIAMKTEGDVCDRSRRTTVRLWWAVMALMGLVTLSTFHVQPHVGARLRAAPWGFGLPLLAASALVLSRWFCLKERDVLAFLASAGFLGATLATVVFSLYPYVLPASTDPSLGLTLDRVAAETYGLKVGLAWWIPGMVLATVYFFFVYRQFAGKVRLDEEEHY